MYKTQKAIGVSAVLFYGLFSPFLTQAQDANDPAKLPTAIEPSELDATSAIAHDIEDLGEDTATAFKNEAEKDVTQLKDLSPASTTGQSPSPIPSDSLSAIEEDERSLEAQANALDQLK